MINCNFKIIDINNNIYETIGDQININHRYISKNQIKKIKSHLGTHDLILEEHLKDYYMFICFR